MKTRARLAVPLLSGATVVASVVVAAYLFDRPRMPLFHFRTVRVLYDALTIWAPAALMSCALAMGLWRRAVIAPAVFAVQSLALVGVRWYATHYEPRQLQVHRVQIESNEIDRPIRIVHVSDIQSAQVSSWEEEVLRAVAELEPDLLIHTGDLVQPLREKEYAIEYDKLAPLLGAVPAPLGRFNVPGDTDWPIRDRLQAKGAPLITLVNTAHEIDLGNGRSLRLLGIDVRTARRAKESRALIDAFVSEAPHAFNLVFAHPPDFVLEAQDYDVDLSLAGHTHGGQVRLPWFGPPVTGTRAPRHLARGFHAFGRTRINTSAGVGAEHAAGLPSIRFNCPPEITLIELIPQTQPAAPLSTAVAAPNVDG